MATSNAIDPDRRRVRRHVVAVSATLMIHFSIGIAADVAREYGKQRRRAPTPTIELIDVEVPALPPKPPPPAPAVPPAPDLTPVTPPPRTARRAVAPIATSAATDLAPVTAPPISDDRAPGGSPTVSLPNAPPSARGVAVRKGAVSSGPIGRGGAGGGTGQGQGDGDGDRPLSIAMIKTQAMPKGDYSYFDARKDYPEEAKRLGIEGKIRIRLTVSDSGRVIAVTAINKLGYGLDEIAKAQALRLEFTPAKDTNDRAVASFVVWTFTFTLPSSS